MAKKKGRVTHLSRDGWATVYIERGDACNDCEAAQFCHTLVDCSKLETRVLNQAGAKVGDLVTIELSSKMVFRGALLLYIIPVMGLLSGAITGAGLSKISTISETGATIAFAFAGLALGFIITTWISRRLISKNRLTPVIKRITNHSSRTFTA